MSNIEKEAQLRKFGLINIAQYHWNDSRSVLYEDAVRRHEVLLTHKGALVANTAPHTGRLPNDKFIVKEPSSESKIAWGEINRPFDAEKFEILKKRMCHYLQAKHIFIQEHYAGADERYHIPIRVVTERASAALFARTMLIREKDPERIANLKPDYTILHAPNFYANPAKDGTNSGAFIIVHFGQKTVLIGGTAYAGEIKKAIFSIMNYHLPQQGILSMHCSANYGKDENDVAVFFGLSGTGKTTLSASSDRTLIGDDEHGWSDDGVFNFEGGCYAKVIRLSSENEPEIYQTTRRFGTLLENVMIDPATRLIDLEDSSITENTRAMYPISSIPNMTLSGKGGIPKNVIMLTCDAFGVLPPVARLTKEQAMYHFLSGYTAKVAGTELGVKEPQATFSPCFGAPFMPLAPSVYAHILGHKIEKHKVRVWLVNTGWSGGAYGVGKRMELPVTRAIIAAILDGSLKDVESREDVVFGFQIPRQCPGVDDKVLDPKQTWPKSTEYDEQAKKLARMFHEHFRESIKDENLGLEKAGPKI